VKLSIVIPVLNRAQHIGLALESAVGQGVDSLEIIAVDGGSSDGTQEVVRKAGVQLIEFPGSSIYEALNRGIAASCGAIIGHLNSDDWIADNALASILEMAESHPAAMIFKGQARYLERDEAGLLHPLVKLDRGADRPLSVERILFGLPAINRCFIRRQAYDKLGLYDERLRIASDRDWLLRAVLVKTPIVSIDTVVYNYLVHPGSLTMATRHRSEARYAAEHRAIAAHYLSGSLDPPIRRLLLRWHGQETVRELLRGGLGSGGYEALGEAFRQSPLWPLHAIRPLAGRARDRLLRSTRAMVAGRSAGSYLA
jgi:glycosyltransferase involved in cell wall biosynthesis